jgi:hypothetical protein
MTGHVPTDVEVSLDSFLEPGERVLGAVTTLAGTLVLTDGRIVILRSGREFRPRSGVRSWKITQSSGLAYGWPHRGLGRLMVGKGAGAISFFVNERDWDDAMDLVTKARAISHRVGAATTPPVGHTLI